MNTAPDEISLYFHIPFCTRKCSYCHFYVIPEEETAKDLLLKGFQKELSLYAPLLQNKNIVSIYFGGGTPSLFGPTRIEKVIQWVGKVGHLLFHAEITLEANPENVTEPLMRAYAKSGINRVSLGIQTLDAGLLHLLGRLHNADTAKQAITTTYHCGIENISIDLMYDLPRQTLKHWENTLDEIQALPIQHLSPLQSHDRTAHPLFQKAARITSLTP